MVGRSCVTLRFVVVFSTRTMWINKWQYLQSPKRRQVNKDINRQRDELVASKTPARQYKIGSETGNIKHGAALEHLSATCDITHPCLNKYNFKTKQQQTALALQADIYAVPSPKKTYSHQISKTKSSST